MIEKIERMPAHVLISLADCAEGRGLRDCRPARITTLRSLHEMRAAYTVEHAQRQIAIMDYLIALSFSIVLRQPVQSPRLFVFYGKNPAPSLAPRLVPSGPDRIGRPLVCRTCLLDTPLRRTTHETQLR